MLRLISLLEELSRASSCEESALCPCSHAALYLLDAEVHVGSFSASPLQSRHPPGSQNCRMKTSSFLLARILGRRVRRLRAEPVSSSTDLHGAIHMLEPLHIWEQGRGGHWVLCLPALHTAPGDPTQRRACNSAEQCSYFYYSISRGLAETCYELSGISHPRRVQTTGPAADCLCSEG